MKAISPKKIAETAMLNIQPVLEVRGFSPYTGKKFLRVVNGVVQLIELFPGKSDFYVWYSCYPIAQKDLSFGSGVIAGRCPDESNKIIVNDESSLFLAIREIVSFLPNVLSFLDDRSSLEAMASCIDDSSNLYSLLIKGLCLMCEGRPDLAEGYIKKFALSGLRGVDIENANDLLVAIDKGG